MDKGHLLALRGFYENELVNNVLPFWVNAEDKENGGFFSCYDLTGEHLISTDKYTWSQGRFVFIFSYMASLDKVFTQAQRKEFLRLAKSGRDFVMKNCLIAPDVWRCTFLMAADGTKKLLPGWDKYDASNNVDQFIVMGLAKYAAVTGDREAYEFAKNLFAAYITRLDTEEPTLPYRWSSKFDFQARYQSVLWLGNEMFLAAQRLDPEYIEPLSVELTRRGEILINSFIDEDGMFHEIVLADHTHDDSMMCRHVNPGHAVLNMMYLMKTGELTNNQQFIGIACDVILRVLETCWDAEYGGYPHFTDKKGGKPVGSTEGDEEEFFVKMLATDWADKLWWTNAETINSALRCYSVTGRKEFMLWHDRMFEYVYTHFPNPNREVREWIQVLDREGRPLEKVTSGVPVKDAMHISRSLAQMIEMLYQLTEKN